MLFYSNFFMVRADSILMKGAGKLSTNHSYFMNDICFERWRGRVCFLGVENLGWSNVLRVEEGGVVQEGRVRQFWRKYQRTIREVFGAYHLSPDRLERMLNASSKIGKDGEFLYAVERLSDGNAEEKIEAIRLLRRFFSSDAAFHLTQLGKGLFDKNEEVRKNAAAALGELVKEKEDYKTIVLENLVGTKKGLYHQNADVRTATLLFYQEWCGKEALEKMREALFEPPVPEFQFEVIRAVGEAKGEKEERAKALWSALPHPDIRVRLALLDAFETIGSPAVLEGLREYQVIEKDPELSVRMRAVDVLRIVAEKSLRRYTNSDKGDMERKDLKTAVDIRNYLKSLEKRRFQKKEVLRAIGEAIANIDILMEMWIPHPPRNKTKSEPFPGTSCFMRTVPQSDAPSLFLRHRR